MMETPNSRTEGRTSDLQMKIASSELSCVSMKSDQSMEHRLHYTSDPDSFKPDTEKNISDITSERPDSTFQSNNMMEAQNSDTRGRASEQEVIKVHSALTCVSMKSDQSIEHRPNLSRDPVPSNPKIEKKTSSRVDSIFKELENKAISWLKKELNGLKKLLIPDYPVSSKGDIEDEEDDSDIRDGMVKTLLLILTKMKEADLANALQRKLIPPCYEKHKSQMRKKFQRINEGLSVQGNSILLNEIYTELYITEGDSGEVNDEHEVRQIEISSRKTATHETPINCNDIFKPMSDEKPIRSVLTKGVAGIGKTVSVQKFILDWAEAKANEDVLFIFPLPFRELNLIKQKLSLTELLNHFFPETHELKPKHYTLYKVMFVFDGLDECRLPLDFQNNERLLDVEKSTSVDVLLTNLIKGNLLPSALLWVTTRPSAASQIPNECFNLLTEVRGFSDPQKEEYFRKRISDQGLANRIIAHMKSSRSLYIMCHIPVFCWIAAIVLERMLSGEESGEIPKTLTQMFTHFLIFQIKHRSQKYDGKCGTKPHTTSEIILGLGKLAFQQLEKGNLIFYEEDLENSGIDVTEISLYSGVCTQIFREESGLHLGKVFCFVHLSVQEFLAALYAFVSFSVNKRNVLEQRDTGFFSFLKKSTMSDFLKSVVDKTLQCKNGQLDLFLRFLLGFSLESNQTLIKGLLLYKDSSAHNKEETIKYIKEKIRENQSPEKSINLFHCLNELNDHSLLQEVQTYLNRAGDQCLHKVKLSPAQWSALVFVLLNSEEELDEFDLSKYDPSEECLLRLLPVVKASRKAVLFNCNLGEQTCENLGAVLQSANSSLRELDLTNNELQDSGVLLLSDGLKSSHCKLEILRLVFCKLGEKSSEVLGSVLQSANLSLRELDLGNNKLQDSGVKLISDGLKSSHCKLETLRLANCNVGEKTCEYLGAVLQSANSSLRELDLSNNELQDSGVKVLSDGLKSSHCTLEIFRLCLSYLGEETCISLGSVLQSANSSLRELDLSNNELKDSGVNLLSDGLKSSHCKLETLRLSGCLVTEEGCSYLTSALSSNPSHLKELDLTYNHPGDSGVKLLSARLEDPHCRLQTLRLEHAGRIRLKPGLKKYACELTLDPNTAHALLSLSEENRKVTSMWNKQSYPDHPERFDYYEQVLCRESLTGRCYFEAEWSRYAVIAVTYKGIRRSGGNKDCWFGHSKKSWSLSYTNDCYTVWYDNIKTDIPDPPFSSNRVGVYLDCSAGTLSFYSVSSDTHTLTHLHTFHSRFTEPLYAGFWVHMDSSLCVCQIE